MPITKIYFLAGILLTDQTPKENFEMSLEFFAAVLLTPISLVKTGKITPLLSFSQSFYPLYSRYMLAYTR
jgi:hypothetical protein